MLDSERAVLAAVIFTLSACATGGGVPGVPGVADGGATNDAGVVEHDTAYREVGEDPLGCADLPACETSGRCSSVQGFCHPWHDEDCLWSSKCRQSPEDGPCCWYGLPMCEACSGAGGGAYGAP